jgi:hypothetical protein
MMISSRHKKLTQSSGQVLQLTLLDDEESSSTNFANLPATFGFWPVKKQEIKRRQGRLLSSRMRPRTPWTRTRTSAYHLLIFLQVRIIKTLLERLL